MPSITLKNLPDDLHQRLKERATRHHRSLNSEIIAALEAVVRSEPGDAAAAIERIRRLRPAGHERLTASDFDALRARAVFDRRRHQRPRLPLHRW